MGREMLTFLKPLMIIPGSGTPARWCLLMWIILGNPLISKAQNLISNPGFEDENICTEYTQNCAPEGWIATSLYANYYFDELNKSAEGRHFIGLTAGSIRKPSVRNFARTRLLCGLRRGKTYRLELLVRSVHPLLDSIGIYFSKDDFLYERRSFRELIPQLWSGDATLGSPDVNGWQTCSFNYTATGDEGYLTIGNFRRNDIKGVRKAEFREDYYFFIDHVRLTPDDPAETLCREVDSVRQNVYSENERHHYLNQKMYVMRKRTPVSMPLPPTLIAVSIPAQKIDTLVVPDIFFATAQYKLLPSSHQLLDSFVHLVKPDLIDSLVITGHTDSVGTLQYNTVLSHNRAKAVKAYLESGLSGMEKLIFTRGYAYLQPVTTNKTVAGRSRNRRVEIYVYRKE
jgi:outer membrane protein OmpA-like peptidoglycan-associated protein